ncbi:MAG: DMT family transporter [Proteobacteria bacterium]|nr:DMT family transporter [Pseudomonadota bacterium]
MNNVLLYTLTVLIWGTTWFAIKLQVGHAPDEISILYRAALAALFLLAWCKIKGFSLSFKIRDHVFLCGLGLSMFSLHYLFVYNAASYIVSGVIAVVFSGVSFLSIANNYIFFRTKPTFNVSLGAFIGIIGLCVFFWDEIARSSLQNNAMKGLGLAAIGSLIFSLGGSISRRNHNVGLDLVPSMAMGMVYGTFAMFIYTFFQSSQFILPESAIYWASLLYLVIPGSVIAFLCYLKLIKNIGPEFASYTTILFPVVALIISSVLEGYTWSANDLFGLVFVLLGNIIVMRKKPLIGLFKL